MRSKLAPLLAAAAATTVLAACGMMGGDSKTDMTFFVSSTGSGKGADLGGPLLRRAHGLAQANFARALGCAFEHH